MAPMTEQEVLAAAEAAARELAAFQARLEALVAAGASAAEVAGLVAEAKRLQERLRRVAAAAARVTRPAA